MRTLLLVLAMIALLVSRVTGAEPREFFGPTGHPYSGFVGVVEDEITLIRLHFELTNEQTQLLEQSVSEHRSALKQMDMLLASLVRDIHQRVRAAGGADSFYASYPDAGLVLVSKRQQILLAQEKLEAQLIDRIRAIVTPSNQDAWNEYLMTRDFERWRQPSQYNARGETIDPLVLFHIAGPDLLQNSVFRDSLQFSRREAHAQAQIMVKAFQAAEEYSVAGRYRTIQRDGEKEHDLFKDAEREAVRLMRVLWKIPDSLFEDHASAAEARAYRETLMSKQALDSLSEPLRPIENSIRNADLVQGALALPDLDATQFQKISAMWSEMSEAYNRACDIHFRWVDHRIRRQFNVDIEMYFELINEKETILNQAEVSLDDIAAVLTPPQWYTVLGNSDSWRYHLKHAFEKASGFDWSTLDFEALIPE